MADLPVTFDGTQLRVLTVAAFDALIKAPRVGSTANGTSGTVTIDLGSYDTYRVTALVNDAFITTSGSPADDQELKVTIKAAAVQAIRWDTIFVPSGMADLPNFTSPGKTITVRFWYDSAAGKLAAFASDPYGY